MKTRTSKRAFFLLTIPAAFLYGMFVILPIAMGFSYSFTDWDGISKEYNFVGAANYIALFKDTRTVNALGITMWYTLLSVVIILVLSFLIALLLNRNLRFRAAIKSIYFFPAVVSLVLVGMIFYNIYLVPLPEIGKALSIDLLSRNLIASADTALLAVLIPNIWQGIAIPLVIFSAGLASIPEEQLEAASIDGANGFRKTLYITLPYMIASIQIVIVLLLRNGITTFDYIQAITNGGPGFATETIAQQIYQNAFLKMKYSFSMAQSILLFVIMAVIAMVQIRLLNKKDVVSL